jgi:hypothetical protein
VHDHGFGRSGSRVERGRSVDLTASRTVKSRQKRACRRGLTSSPSSPTEKRRRRSRINVPCTLRGVGLLRQLTRPVLKHGPRSLDYARVKGLAKPQGETKVKREGETGSSPFFLSSIGPIRFEVRLRELGALLVCKSSDARLWRFPLSYSPRFVSLI